MRRLIFILILCVFGYEPVALAGDFVCKIAETDTDADLDSAGPNARCGKNQPGPWACYCELTEECRDEDSGQTQTYHRRQFLGCGALGDCNSSSEFGRQCRAMED